MKYLIPAILLTVSSQFALGQTSEATEAKIKSAIESDIRTERETDRDRNRRPLQTLKFFGLQDDMKVLELLPGGGWYTKIIAPVLRDNGEYYAAVGTSRLEQNLVGKGELDKVKVVGDDAEIWRPEGEYFYDAKIKDLGVDDLDIVFTFRNYHNLSAQGRAEMNKAVFEALKPGGVYAVIDHTKRHMEEPSRKNRRRVDPIIAIKEIQDAGFTFEDYSTLHYREDDELEYEVGARSVTGNTDRFTFKFVKPLK